ncbi:MAG: PilZ domain-containing protein [Candidatus Methylomirabilales bacterium]
MTQKATRQHPRFPLRMPVLSESPAVSGYRTVGFTENVSRAGLLLVTPQPLPVGSPASLLLPTGDRNARVEALVVWASEGSPCQMGLKFTTWAGADRLSWERLLDFQAGPNPRASLRTPIALDVTCVKSSGVSVSARAENISDGGLMLTLAESLPRRTRLTVAVPTWHTIPPVKVEVMWTQRTPDQHGTLHGLRFLSDDTRKELFIVGALLRQIADQNETASGRQDKG